MLEAIFITGVCIGVIIGYVGYNIKASNGKLVIDKTNPNKDLYRFEINDLDHLDNMKWVRLRISKCKDVNNKNDI